MNGIELNVVNYLLFPPTRFAITGNGHLNIEPAVAFTCSIVYKIGPTIKPNYPDQSSKTDTVFVLCDFTNH